MWDYVYSAVMAALYRKHRNKHVTAYIKQTYKPE